MKWHKHWKHSTNDNPSALLHFPSRRTSWKHNLQSREGLFWGLKKDLGTQFRPRFLQWERAKFLKRPWFRGKVSAAGKRLRKKVLGWEVSTKRAKNRDQVFKLGKKKKKNTCAGRRVGRGRVHQRERITGERYIQYRWQLSEGERRKCIESGSRYTRGGRRREIGKRDIANKGDIVWDADDSRAAEEPESACDTGSLKPSPALSLPLTSFALPQHLFLLPSFRGKTSDAALFFPLRSRRIGEDIFCPLFFLSLSGCLSTVRPDKVQAMLSFELNVHLVTHNKNTTGVSL